MSQIILQVQTLTGSILELLSSQPNLVSELNFTLQEDRDKFKSTCDLSNKEAIASRLLPLLSKQADNFPNVSSQGDYFETDICGMYPADDPRSGWWLISIGYLFVHIVIGYPDEVVRQAIEAKDLEHDDENYIAPDEFEGLICDIEENELDRLIDIFSIVSAKPRDLTDQEFVEIDELCRGYCYEEHDTIADLIPEEQLKLMSILPERSFLQVAAYQPGVYVYSLDPELPFKIENSVVSIRRNDGTHYMYLFKDLKVTREPPFTINQSLHDSIMNDK